MQAQGGEESSSDGDGKIVNNIDTETEVGIEVDVNTSGDILDIEEKISEENDLFDEAILNPSNQNLWGSQEKKVSTVDSSQSSRTEALHKFPGQNSPDKKDGNPSYDIGGLNIDDNLRGHRKFQAYIANLTWWTTDEDLEKAIHGIGVPYSDLDEIKIFEHRNNGQSKGFCIVFLNSESSHRLLFSKLPKVVLHGKNPVVRLCNRQSLAECEAESGTRQSQSCSGPVSAGGIPISKMNPGGGPLLPPPFLHGPDHRVPGPRWGPGHGPHPHDLSQPHPGNGRHRSSRSSMPISGPGYGGPMFGFGEGRRMPNPAHAGENGLRHHGPPNCYGPPRFPPNFPSGPLPPPNGGMNSPLRPPGVCGPVANMPNGHNAGPPLGHGLVPNNCGGNVSQPHVNPAFLNGPPPGSGNMLVHQQLQGTDAISNSPISFESSQDSQRSQPPMEAMYSPPKLSPREFEDILDRNRTVSGSAISRAVSDAAEGEYANAIETLVTAISLIRSSKVAHDSRCKILVSSLEDTLAGIESRSYGSNCRNRIFRTKSRSRSRSRSNRYRRRFSHRDRHSRSRSRSMSDSRSRRRRDSERHRDHNRSRENRDSYVRRHRSRSQSSDCDRGKSRHSGSYMIFEKN